MNDTPNPVEKGVPHTLSYCGDMVYRQDRDRFLSAMTTPADKREALFALYAFNLEISKVEGLVSELILGHIRFQWWQDAIEECYRGTPRRHAVVTALSSAIRQAGATRSLFEDAIEERERDLDYTRPQTLSALESYALATSGGLCELALELTWSQDRAGQISDEIRKVARQVGTAWALIGLMRALPFQLRERRVMIPSEVLDEFGVSEGDLSACTPTEGLRHSVEHVCERASSLLVEARTQPVALRARREAFGALSLGVLADHYLRHLKKVGFETFDPRMAARPVTLVPALYLRSLRGRY